VQALQNELSAARVVIKSAEVQTDSLEKENSELKMAQAKATDKRFFEWAKAKATEEAAFTGPIEEFCPSDDPVPSDLVSEYWIGLDLGGTTVSAVLVDSMGAILAKTSQKIPEDAKTPNKIASNLAAAAETVLESSGVSLLEISGIGLGTPGNLDFDLGLVKNASNFPDWKDVPLPAMVEAALEIKIATVDGSKPCQWPVVLENDANAALLAEVWAGAGKGKDHVVMITLGTGIGGGVWSDGRVLKGARGMAGEIGHMILERDGRLNSGTGVRGIAEEYASAGGIGRWGRELVSEGTKTSLSSVPVEEIDARLIFEHADAGDSACIELLSTAMEVLGILCIDVCRAYDPEVIVMTGGLTLRGSKLFDAVWNVFLKHHWSIQEPTCRIVPAECGNEAGAIGAAYAAKLKLLVKN